MCKQTSRLRGQTGARLTVQRTEQTLCHRTAAGISGTYKNDLIHNTIFLESFQTADCIRFPDVWLNHPFWSDTAKSVYVPMMNVLIIPQNALFFYDHSQKSVCSDRVQIKKDHPLPDGLALLLGLVPAVSNLGLSHERHTQFGCVLHLFA